MQNTVPRNIKSIFTKNGINWKITDGDLTATSYKIGETSDSNGKNSFSIRDYTKFKN